MRFVGPKRHKRPNREVIRMLFGSDARIRGFGGSYRIKTDTGGEVIVRPRLIRLVTGGDDVFRASVLLAGHLWGGGVARRGSREFVLGAVAHGEAAGVKIRGDYTDPKAASRRMLVSVVIVLAAMWSGVTEQADGALITGAVVLAIYAGMARSAKLQAQREGEQLGYHYPRVSGAAGATRHDDAARRGWL